MISGIGGKTDKKWGTSAISPGPGSPLFCALTTWLPSNILGVESFVNDMLVNFKFFLGTALEPKDWQRKTNLSAKSDPLTDSGSAVHGTGNWAIEGEKPALGMMSLGNGSSGEKI